MEQQPFKRVEARLAGRKWLTTTAAVSERMARVRQRGTGAEIAVRRAATASGLRYTIGNRDLPGSPDLANRTRRFAIFVHGCYWHQHRGCPRATVPKTNRGYWLAKFVRNVERDRKVRLELRRMGFRVLTVWECEAEETDRLLSTVRRFAATLD